MCAYDCTKKNSEYHLPSKNNRNRLRIVCKISECFIYLFLFICKADSIDDYGLTQLSIVFIYLHFIVYIAFGYYFIPFTVFQCILRLFILQSYTDKLLPYILFDLCVSDAIHNTCVVNRYLLLDIKNLTVSHDSFTSINLAWRINFLFTKLPAAYNLMAFYPTSTTS